jgi:PAS domain S-box-containing protein
LGDHTVVGELRAALAKDELELHYQPIVGLRSGRLRAAEALVRWSHPDRGLIAPDAFIPLVEGTPLFWDFTLHVTELGVRQAAAWRAQGLDLPVAVNIAAGDLLDPRLPLELERLLARHGVPPSALELEVTEGALMDDVGRAAHVLREVHRIGVDLIALDDFGTGFSSLARLRDLPIEAIKIDRSFIAEMSAAGDSALVRSIIALAHNLGLHVVAEGIEDAATWERLALLGCEFGQGFHIARPLTAAAFAAWLARYQPTAKITSEMITDRRTGPGRRHSDYFAVAFENAPEAMLIADDGRRWIDGNRAASELLGLDKAGLRRRHVGDFSAADSAAEVEALWQSLVQDGEIRARWTLVTPDGDTRGVDFTAQANFMPGLHLFVFRPSSEMP